MNQHTEPRYWAIIPAAGKGLRMDGEIPKQYLSIDDYPVLCHTLSQFLAHPSIAGVILVLSEQDHYWSDIEYRDPNTESKLFTCIGGKERVNSVLAGLNRLKTLAVDKDSVLVHDAARPGINAELIDRVIATSEQENLIASNGSSVEAKNSHGVIVATPAVDTLKQVDSSGYLVSTLNRSNIWHAQTPQCFNLKDLHKALQLAVETISVEKDRHQITDEASAVERLNIKTKVVRGSEQNFKITRQGDLERSREIVKEQLLQNKRCAPEKFFKKYRTDD